MNSVFFLAYYPARWLRYLAAALTYVALVQWVFNPAEPPWAPAFFCALAVLWQSIENVCLDQGKQWERYLDRLEFDDDGLEFDDVIMVEEIT